MGNFQGATFDVFEKLSLIRVEIRGNADKHLIDEHTEKVPVDGSGVAGSLQHLRS